VQGINNTNMPGLQGTPTTGNNLAMRGLLVFLSGSLRQVNQLYYVGSADRLDTWDDYLVSVQRTREINQNEMSFFFKDDWKVHRDLTLNLGLRWDYYGVPWVSKGLTSSLLGGGNALFGYGLNEAPGQIDIILVNSPMERGRSVRLGRIHIDTLFDQCDRRRLVPRFDRIHERHGSKQ
jgi:hypothetical protein